MQQFIKTLAIISCLGLSTVAYAQVTPETNTSAPAVSKTFKSVKTTSKQKARLLFLLSGYEFFPKRVDLDKIGNEAQIGTLLLSIAMDTKMSTVKRIRAVDAMGYYNTTPTNAYLNTLLKLKTDKITDKGQLRFVMSQRHHAATSLAKATGPAALPTLQHLLNHKDFQLRITAISAIGKHCGKAGKTTLKKLQAVEKDPIIQRSLRKHLR